MDKNRKDNIYRFEAVVLTTLLLVSFIPLIIISIYDVPSADDYSMGLQAGLAFRETHSIFRTLAAGAEKTILLYRTWIGYYSSAFLSTLPPQTWGDGSYYGITLIISLGSLCLGTWLLLRIIFMRILRADRCQTACITAITLMITVWCIPEGNSRVEGLYWYSGAINYTFMYGVALCWIAMLVEELLCITDTDMSGTQLMKNREQMLHLLRYILIPVLGFIVGGANYMTSLTCAIISVLFIVVGIVLVRCKTHKSVMSDQPAVASDSNPQTSLKSIMIPCLCQLAGFTLSCLAPGNRVRGGMEYGMSPVTTILTALYDTYALCIRQWTGWPVILLLLLLIPFIWKAAEHREASNPDKAGYGGHLPRFPLPGIAAILAYGLASANIAPPLFATGNIEAGRIRAIYWMQYVLLLILTEIYVIGWLRRVTRRNNHEEPAPAVKSMKIHQAYMAVIAVLFVIYSLLTVRSDHDRYTVTQAVAELSNGEAKSYREQYLERLDILEDRSVKKAILTPYEENPGLLYYSDITSDPKDWSNKALANYYGKKKVRIKNKHD